MSALLLIFLILVFFFIVKFTAALVTIMAIIMGTTTITVLVCIWFGTSYYLRMSGYDPNSAEQTYRRVDSDLKQMTGDLQKMRFELQEAEPYLRDMEFLRYAGQNHKAKN